MTGGREVVEGTNTVFGSAGEAAALGRELDWARTSLGAVDQWPRALQVAVRTALESAFPINLWCGPDLVLIYNDAYRRVLGSKHPRAFGRPGQEAWAELWPEIGPLFDEIRAGSPAVYEEDAHFTVSREEGEPEHAWFTFALSPIRADDGEIVAFLNIVSETTARIRAERDLAGARDVATRAEERLREVFAQAPAFLAVLRGPDHVFEFVNEAYHHLVGRRDLVGKRVVDALPEVVDQGFVQLLDTVLRSGTPYRGREVAVSLSRSDGEPPEERYVDFVYQPLIDSTGSKVGIVAHGSDVTDQVIARREVEQAREVAEAARHIAEAARAEADAANAAKSEFLAMMSHEFRTPLNGILGYEQLLEMEVAGPVTDQQRDYLHRLSSSARHLLGLVNDVLDLSKIDADQLTVAAIEAPAGDAVREALAITMPQVEGRALTVLDELASSSAVTYVGDPDRVRQILVNLLSNAAKFTDAGGEIRLAAGAAVEAPAEVRVAGGGPWTFIRVEDTGIGIPPEMQNFVFEPFVQAEQGRTRTKGGTGLGLAISRRLARLMGGDLSVTSTPGEGSAFTLWLPARREATDAAPVGAPPDTVADDPSRETAAGRVARARQQAGMRPVRRLGEIGTILRQEIEQTIEDWAGRIRSDSAFAVFRHVPAAQIEDHMLSYLSDLVQSLVIVEQTGGLESDLLADGTEIQLTIARKHGEQRYRLGWSEGHLAREWEFVTETLAARIRRHAPADADDTKLAVGVIARLVAHARAASIGAFRSLAKP